MEIKIVRDSDDYGCRLTIMMFDSRVEEASEIADRFPNFSQVLDRMVITNRLLDEGGDAWKGLITEYDLLIQSVNDNHELAKNPDFCLLLAAFTALLKKAEPSGLDESRDCIKSLITRFDEGDIYGIKRVAIVFSVLWNAYCEGYQQRVLSIKE